jgi:hypothetical protein
MQAAPSKAIVQLTKLKENRTLVYRTEVIQADRHERPICG